MAVLTMTDVSAVMAEMNARYQPDDGRCVATPAQMNLLLNRLDAYTKEVQQQAKKEGLDDDSNVTQWALDMGAWQQRMQHYRSELEQIPKDKWQSPESCEAIYMNVTAPLLDGFYYEVLPGIVYAPDEKAAVLAGAGHGTFKGFKDIARPHPAGHSNPKPPDVATPFSLGNQVLVYQQHQKERWDKFWEDLWSSAEALAKRTGKALKEAGKVAAPLGMFLFGAAAVVGVGYVLYRVAAGNKRKKPKVSQEEKAIRRADEAISR